MAGSKRRETLRKFTDEQVLHIRRVYPRTSMQSLADKYGVAITTIDRILKRKSYKDVLATDRPEKRYDERKAYYYKDKTRLHISVDNLNLTFDLMQKKFNGMDYNIHLVGESIKPEEAVKILQDHGFLPQ